MALGYGRVGTNNFSGFDFIVDADGIQNGATHSTLTAAFADATDGTSIAIRPGTYTEDLTIPVGIRVFAIKGSVTVVGKLSQSATWSSSFANINFQTNGDVILDFTGSGLIQTNFDYCTFKRRS